MAKKKQKKSQPKQLDLRETQSPDDIVELDPDNLLESTGEMGIGLESASSPDAIHVTPELLAAQGKLEQLLERMSVEEQSVRSEMAFAEAIGVDRATAADGVERVVGTGIGLRTVNGVPTGEPAVKVFINQRAMRAGSRVSEDIPTTIDGLPVDVQVMGEIFLQGFSQRFARPVPCGCSISNVDADARGNFRSAGTLGALVRLNNNKLCFISNNHVIGDFNRGLIGRDRIIQPGTLDQGSISTDLVGVLENVVELRTGSVNRVDGATAFTAFSRVEGRHVTYQLNPTPLAPTLNLSVMKNGRTTGPTMGQIVAINFRTSPIFYPGIGGVVFTEQIVIQGTGGRFSASGDSGSLIVSAGTRQPVGLLFAGSDTFTIANPISAVMRELNISEFLTADAIT